MSLFEILLIQKWPSSARYKQSAGFRSDSETHLSYPAQSRHCEVRWRLQNNSYSFTITHRVRYGIAGPIAMGDTPHGWNPAFLARAYTKLRHAGDYLVE